MNYDLTVGDPRKTLWKFTFPMFISVIFQQFYSITDSAIAGKFAGESALAAIGASYPITMIFMAIATGSNIGCTVVISQLFGAKKFKDMNICDALHLGVGNCGVCEKCAKLTNEPCRYPDLALPSLESYGVNVSELAKASGMKYINGQNTVTYFGAVLFNI